jgi:predicted AAA+ superfamily ATPase
MAARTRLYEHILRDHFTRNRQMALVSGPRQVGKTTACRALGSAYLNWDNADDRRLIQRGPAAVAAKIQLERLRKQPLTIVFDELHKHRRWKTFLKGFFDVYGERCRVLVTGSSRLDVFRRGGDSLMGRYFPYRMHPYSVAECISATLPTDIVRPPQPIADKDWNALWRHGGFPEPFLRREARFTRRWHSLRREQLTTQDIRDIAQIQDHGALDTLSYLLEERSSQQLIYSNLANEIGVSVATVQRWVGIFERLYYGFRLRPWFANLGKALRKEPKWFLRDWAGIDDPSARAETLVACHLLKAVEGWTDLGLGNFELRYLRDKLQREVDFLIVRERKPWCLVEVKTNRIEISPSLRYFQTATKAPFAFQVVMELPFVEANCFKSSGILVVPARTFLSQLL